MNFVKKLIFKKKVRNAIELLHRLDVYFTKMKWSKKDKKQFWRNFVKSPSARDICLRAILKEVKRF